MEDMLIIAMGRLLPATDMDMLLPELPMVDMLLSAMDMSLPEPPMWICSSQPWVWICSNYGYSSPDYNHRYASLNYRPQDHGPGY